MRVPRSLYSCAAGVALTLLLLVSIMPVARADDGIFEAAPAAKSRIDFDGRGFLVNGKREFIASGTLHYPRVPRALWRDRLLRIKRAGFNCIETYAFWNLHEPREGRWDFTGDKDLNAFLALVHDIGMYAIVRVGPYVCAEWDSGGYPVWLRFKPGIRVREDNPQFEAAVDRWYEKVMPIVSANQIHRGGAVIMVQLENEHPLGWGKEMPNGYFRHLRDKALALGLEVPYFFSGLHHGSDPAGDRPWDSKGRINPWFTTEFWPGWYDLYGPLNELRYRGFVRGNWKILANGGNGYNYYMLHGGTNFDTWNDDEVASCYDYGAAVGQAGDLRPIYYAFKHAALFARSFPDILENSSNVTDEVKASVTGAGLRVTGRHSPSGEILFIDNNSDHAAQAVLTGFEDHPLTVMPGEIRPVVRRYPLLPNVVLEACTARILGIARQGDVTTLVVFGTPGKGVGVDRVDTDERPEREAFITLTVPSEGAELPKKLDAGAEITSEPDGDKQLRLRLRLPYPAPDTGSPTMSTMLSFGGRRLRIVSLSYELAQRTWFAETNGRSYVVCGPEILKEIEERDGALLIHAEVGAQRGYSRPVFAPQYGITVFTPSGAVEHPKIADAGARAVLTGRDANANELLQRDFQAPAHTEWEMHRADAEAAPDYFAGKWKFDITPSPMGSDGDTSAYAWYRTTLRAPKAGDCTLGFSDAGDWITVFVNGARVRSSSVKQRFNKPAPREIVIPLKAGENSIAVFTAHYGRHKLFNYLGPINTIDAKGLCGPVFLSRDAVRSVDVTAWRWRAGSAADAKLEIAPTHTDTGGADWSDARIGEDVFRKKPGYAWYHTVLPAIPGPHRRLRFTSVDDDAAVYLNGKRLLTHRGWDDPFEVKLDSAWREGVPNELLVLVQNFDNTGGIAGGVTLVTNSAQDGLPVSGWRERGGVGNPASIRGWQPMRDSGAPNVPAFYRTEFPSDGPRDSGAQSILRFVPLGMSRGFVWLNGHNLGRYPEKTRAPGIYLPECWITRGANTLVVFDEEGKSPSQSYILNEAEACRFAYEASPSPVKTP